MRIPLTGGTSFTGFWFARSSPVPATRWRSDPRLRDELRGHPPSRSGVIRRPVEPHCRRRLQVVRFSGDAGFLDLIQLRGRPGTRSVHHAAHVGRLQEPGFRRSWVQWRREQPGASPPVLEASGTGLLERPRDRERLRAGRGRRLGGAARLLALRAFEGVSAQVFRTTHARRALCSASS